MKAVTVRSQGDIVRVCNPRDMDGGAVYIDDGEDIFPGSMIGGLSPEQCRKLASGLNQLADELEKKD